MTYRKVQALHSWFCVSLDCFQDSVTPGSLYRIPPHLTKGRSINIESPKITLADINRHSIKYNFLSFYDLVFGAASWVFILKNIVMSHFIPLLPISPSRISPKAFNTTANLFFSDLHWVFLLSCLLWGPWWSGSHLQGVFDCYCGRYKKKKQ